MQLTTAARVPARAAAPVPRARAPAARRVVAVRAEGDAEGDAEEAPARPPALPMPDAAALRAKSNEVRPLRARTRTLLRAFTSGMSARARRRRSADVDAWTAACAVPRAVGAIG